MEQIEFRELVELFLHISFQEIKNEEETPNINFHFGEDGFSLFQSIVEDPFIKLGFWTPDATKEDIDFILNHNNDDVLTLYINDSMKFFKYLTDIVNGTIALNNEAGIATSARNLAMHILKRIWLRMGIEDIANVNNFLEKQLQFIRNRTFDNYLKEKVNSLNEYDVFMEIYVNPTWDESTRSMIFTIKGDKQIYELPYVLYDIDDNGVCYIYAIQSSKNRKDKKVERELYKINKNITMPNVHPSKVYALMFFIQELKKKNISKIKIPSMQVLSYRYHELLSAKAKQNLEEAEMELAQFPTDNYSLNKYKFAKNWYDATYRKWDKISYLKTEELFNLAYRLLEHDPSLEIVNEVNIQGDYLGIKIK